jgi:membrane protease YdiL (CAAX protease family)
MHTGTAFLTKSAIKCNELRKRLRIPSHLARLADGLDLGLMYLAFRRNLAIPIVAHGVCNTIDIALLFLGKYPGL